MGFAEALGCEGLCHGGGVVVVVMLVSGDSLLVLWMDGLVFGEVQ